MSHRIGVDFTGLCVFSTLKVPKRLSVLLAADPHGHVRHRPILSFNVRNYKLFAGGPMSEVIQLPDGRQVASWDLEGKIVRLTPGRGAHPKDVMLCGGGVPASRMPMDPVSEMDLCWVPSLSRIAGKRGINPVYLSDNPVPRSGGSALTARVDVDRGFLFSHAAVNRLQPSEAWTIPTASGKPLQQYLADTVRLEIEVDSDKPLEIQAMRFGSRTKEVLTLEPVDGRIEFSITNFPDVLPARAVQSKSMTHFSAYYHLLEPIPKKMPIPRLGASNGHDMPDPGTPPGPHPHAHETGPQRAAIQGVHPVKCTPGMVP